jgi:hypothetical protein
MVAYRLCLLAITNLLRYLYDLRNQPYKHGSLSSKLSISVSQSPCLITSSPTWPSSTSNSSVICTYNTSHYSAKVDGGIIHHSLDPLIQRCQLLGSNLYIPRQSHSKLLLPSVSTIIAMSKLTCICLFQYPCPLESRPGRLYGCL